MKVVIAGDRNCDDRAIVKEAIEESGFEITEVISGGARGVDTVGEEWATDNGIPFARFPADWERYGRAAGPKRNKQMAEYGDALVAVLALGSRGTKNMIGQMQKLKKPIHVKEI